MNEKLDLEYVYLPSRELTYPQVEGPFEDDFSELLKVGDVSFWEGNIENITNIIWVFPKIVVPPNHLF